MPRKLLAGDTVAKYRADVKSRQQHSEHEILAYTRVMRDTSACMKTPIVFI